MFSAFQLGMLEAKLKKTAIKQRNQAGMQLSYIEGWHAIAEANRIFGFGRWTRETISMECVATNAAKCTYIACVRVTVHDEKCGAVSRTGTGAGHGNMKDAGQNHESASKEAETDAMKRALMTFGNQFGLALYDKDQAEVETPKEANEEAAKKKKLDDESDKAWIDEAVTECNETEWNEKSFHNWKNKIRDQFKFINQRNEEMASVLIDSIAEKDAAIQESNNAK
jgi:DNA repair and recombination protein RAD52